MKRRTLFAAVFIAAAAALMHAFFSGGKAQPEPAGTGVAPPVTLVSARGRVEPVSEEIEIASQITGRLASVPVKEGDRVAAGQIIAVIENDEYRARVMSGAARLAEKEAVLRRVENGARSQERLEALAAVQEAEAVMENARAETERRRQLLEKGAVSREEADRASEKLRVARARYDAAVQHHRLVADDAREEDRAKAMADVDLARGELAEARAQLGKTFLRSPIRGVVLRKHRNSGETANEAEPVITVGDMSRLRVRAEIDESDIAAVAVGNKAYVTADAYQSRQFPGKVTRIGSSVGRKTVVSDEPSERVDRKVLEALIDLAPGTRLPSGLRVDVFIDAGDGDAGS